MNTDKRPGLWRILSPVVIYFLINFVVEIIGSTICILQVLKDEAFSLDMSPENLVELVFTYASQIAQYIVIISAAVCIPVFWRMFQKDKKADGTVYTKTAPVNYIWAALLGMTVCLVGNNLIYFSGLLEISSATQEVINGFYQGKLALELIGFCLITPLSEELLFRGLVYGRMREVMPALRAVVMASLFFALFHGNLVQGIYGFLSGCLLCYVYERYKSFWAPVLFHVAANLLSVLGSETGILDFMYTDKTVFLSVTFGMALLLVLCVYLIEIRVQVREVVKSAEGETKVKVEL